MVTPMVTPIVAPMVTPMETVELEDDEVGTLLWRFGPLVVQKFIFKEDNFGGLPHFVERHFVELQFIEL
jgi:hypothetical protein